MPQKDNSSNYRQWPSETAKLHNEGTGDNPFTVDKADLEEEETLNSHTHTTAIACAIVSPDQDRPLTGMNIWHATVLVCHYIRATWQFTKWIGHVQSIRGYTVYTSVHCITIHLNPRAVIEAVGDWGSLYVSWMTSGDCLWQLKIVARTEAKTEESRNN